MPFVDLCLTRSLDAAGVRLGEPLLDAYLELQGLGGGGPTAAVGRGVVWWTLLR